MIPDWFMYPSELLAKSLAFWFSLGLVIATAITVFGVVGEYAIGDEPPKKSYKPPPKPRRWCGIRMRGFELIVAVGVALEMLAEGGAVWFSDRLDTILRNEISDLNAEVSPRDLKADEYFSIEKQLELFRGRTVLVQSYMGDTEGHRLLFIVTQILGAARLITIPGYWYPDTSPTMAFLSGMEIDAPSSQADLAGTLQKAFSGTGVGLRERWFPNDSLTGVTIHIGVKPFFVPTLTRNGPALPPPVQLKHAP